MKWTRHLKLSWVLGLMVITASLLGANHVLHAPNGPNGPKAPEANNARERPDRAADRGGANRGSHVTTTGVIVPENDIVPLIPSVKGEVVEVMVKNDDAVKKSQTLLKMDDRHAKNLLEQAKLGVTSAETALEQAHRGMEQFIAEQKAQQTMIALRKKEQQAVVEKLQYLEPKRKLSQSAEQEYLRAETELEVRKLAVQGEQEKLEAINLRKPDFTITQAKAAIQAAKLKRDEAQLGVDACTLKAPADGVIMQSLVAPGSKFGEQAVKPAFLFYSGKLIVKAEVNQEWANRVAVGQTAEITDYSNNGQKWTGKVRTVGRGFLPKREATALTDLIPQNQEMVLECRIELDPGQKVPFLNQKVRVRLTGN